MPTMETRAKTKRDADYETIVLISSTKTRLKIFVDYLVFTD